MFTIEFHEIPLEAFRELPAELTTESFFRANELTGAYAALRAERVLNALGVPPGAPPPASGEAVKTLGLAQERAGAWDFLVGFVARARRLRGDGESPDPGFAAADGPGALRARILEERPELAPALDVIDAAACGYPEFLRGRKDGGAVLFDPARPGLWERYFDNANPVYAAGNTLAAHAAAAALGGRLAAGGLRILEVGAGCGSAAEALLDRLGGSVSSYTGSDLSPGFLRKARERLEARRRAGLELRFRILDLDRPAAEWGLPRRSFDAVLAVNVLHSVRDLVASLRGLEGLIVPDGSLVLGECVRPERGRPVHPEFVFQLLEAFRGPLLDPEVRPEPGFLDAPSWRAALERAGFRAVRFIPEFEAAVAAYPEHSLAAITASPSIEG
jgi:SAM-dependent methyltransferase